MNLRDYQRLLLHLDWSEGGWRDYVPEEMRELWDHLGFDARVVAMVLAKERQALAEASPVAPQAQGATT